MTRLIDADTLRAKLDELGWTVENGFQARIHIDSIIENTPTVEINTNDIEYKAYCKGLEDGKKIARPKAEWVYTDKEDKED